jgi:hypothetical protein
MRMQDNAVVYGSASSLDMDLSIVAATHLELRKSYAMVNYSLTWDDQQNNSVDHHATPCW